MTIDVRFEQPWNVRCLIVVIEFGIVTEVNPKQPSKAYSSMVITVFGIITDVNSEQSLNADTPTVVTEYDSPSMQMLCGITMEPAYLSSLSYVTSAVILSWFRQ